jgi:hypothetical protein
MKGFNIVNPHTSTGDVDSGKIEELLEKYKRQLPNIFKHYDSVDVY